MHERHYTIRQLSRLTGIDYHTLRRRILTSGWPIIDLQHKRNHCIRVPESSWNGMYNDWKKGGRQ